MLAKSMSGRPENSLTTPTGCSPKATGCKVRKSCGALRLMH